jgi:hypothetical protein
MSASPNSFFSACVSRRTDTASAYRRIRSIDWMDQQAHRFQLCMSAEVIAELSHQDFPFSREALTLTQGIPLLDITTEVVQIATRLIEALVMPGPLRGDAIHVAVAAYHQVEYILSWNVKHLANPNKRVHLSHVLSLSGCVAPQIVRPDVLETDDE